MDLWKNFKQSENMKTRFKTKQELHKDYPGRTLIRYGETPNYHEERFYSAGAFTTNKHPYEGKPLKIQVTPKESKEVQEKAFAIGYNWSHHGRQIANTKSPLLYFRNNNITHGYTCFEEQSKYDIELTPQQFMDGWIPDDTGYNPELDMGINLGSSGEAKKHDWNKYDAYISGSNTLVWYEDNKIHSDLSVRHAYKFNLMSEEDFKKKHPDKLKFKEWEVGVSDKHIKVGCEEFRKVDLERWAKISDTIIESSVSLIDAFDFITTNKKVLGLDF